MEESDEYTTLLAQHAGVSIAEVNNVKDAVLKEVEAVLGQVKQSGSLKAVLKEKGFIFI